MECPVCLATIPRRAAYCPRCGRHLIDIAAETPANLSPDTPPAPPLLPTAVPILRPHWSRIAALGLLLGIVAMALSIYALLETHPAQVSWAAALQEDSRNLHIAQYMVRLLNAEHYACWAVGGCGFLLGWVSVIRKRHFMGTAGMLLSAIAVAGAFITQSAPLRAAVL